MATEQTTDSAADRVAPEKWVDAYGDYLYRYAYSRLRDGNSAEETVQETFLAGIRYREQFTGRGSEQAWLLGILKRKIVDFIRRREKHQRSSPWEEEQDPSAQLFDANGNWRSDSLPWSMRPDRRMQQSELLDIVRDCLTKMPSNQADVFVLSVMEQLDSEEICKHLEITPSNLWVRLHRARLALARCVGPRWQEDGDEWTGRSK